jgi:hypothetical protein
MPEPVDRGARGGGQLAETLAAYRTGEDMSEDGAMALAAAELAATRRAFAAVDPDSEARR